MPELRDNNFRVAQALGRRAVLPTYILLLLMMMQTAKLLLAVLKCWVLTAISAYIWLYNASQAIATAHKGKSLASMLKIAT